MPFSIRELRVVVLIGLVAFNSCSGCEDQSQTQGPPGPQPCSASQVLIGTICVDLAVPPSCKDNETIVDGSCVPKTIPDCSTDASLCPPIPQCAVSEKLVDGVCVPLVCVVDPTKCSPLCFAGEVLLDGQCVSQECITDPTKCPTPPSAQCDKTKDADCDGHAALDQGGDDCDEKHASIHPGATEYTDAPDTKNPNIDWDCDGLPGATLTNGYVVDAKNGNDGSGDGSATKPFKTFATAVNALTPVRKNLYLISGKSYTAGAVATLPPTTGIYGGYGFTGGVWSRNVAQPSEIVFPNDHTVSVVTNNGGAGERFVIDGVKITPMLAESGLLLSGVSAALRDVTFSGTGEYGFTPLLLVGGSGSTMQVNGRHVTVKQQGKKGLAQGIILNAQSGGQIDFTLRESTIQLEGGLGTSIGILGVAPKNSNGAAGVVNVTVVDSTIVAGNGDQSYGVQFGNSAGGTVGRVVLERNRIRAGVATKESAGVALYNASARAVLRNNIIRGNSDPTTIPTKFAKGVQIVNADAVLINNTMIDAVYAVQIQALGKSVALINNILFASENDVDLFVDPALTLQSLSNNLFGVPPGGHVTLYHYWKDNLSSFIPDTAAKSVIAINQTPFVEGGANIVGDPRLNGNGHLLPGSPAIGGAKIVEMLPEEQLAGLFEKEITMDIDGNPRGSQWDIGADEFVGAKSPLAPPPLNVKPLLVPIKPVLP